MLTDTLARCELARPFPALLPAWAVPSAPTDARHDYLLLKAALRQVLARCPGAVARRDFVATRKAYRALCVQPWLHLPLRLPVRLSPYLLNDALHEVAALVGKPVRDAALRCIRRMRPGGLASSERDPQASVAAIDTQQRHARAAGQTRLDGEQGRLGRLLPRIEHEGQG